MSTCQHLKISILRVGSIAENLQFEGSELVKHENVPIQELRRVVVRCLECGVVRTYEAGMNVPERITRLLEQNPYSVDEKQVLGNLIGMLTQRPGQSSPGDLLSANRLPLELRPDQLKRLPTRPGVFTLDQGGKK